ncbi:MAG: DUF4252 domain-containing protein [Acidobacteriota bacterium]|nr:DUF4252 domain-containing protein [Acidobacteriota bacterium]
MFKRLFIGSCTLLMAFACMAADPPPGQIDPEQFLRLADDEDVRIEVSLRGALLKAITKIDPELHALAGGLESINVVVLSLKEAELDRTRRQVRQIDEDLQSRGWQRLARVREEDAEIKVLVLNNEEQIQGLVVMVIEMSEGQLIFANVAGEIDLESLSQIGEQLDIPGLESIDVD